ncbi:hypothetical protein ACQ3HE_06775 [Plantibacter auratus]|uniref:hypothetical protein n=1 Tax=Plantibacter auratus TaxID=272914 RepID=UPI003D32C47D
MKVDIDPKVWWALEDRAEASGLTLEQFLTVAAASYEPTMTTPQKVRALWEQGKCDADIAGEMKVAPASVAAVRRQLGLPANKRYRRAA